MNALHDLVDIEELGKFWMVSVMTFLEGGGTRAGS